VSKDRQPNPQGQTPLTAYVQEPYPHVTFTYQPFGNRPGASAEPERAETYYNRAGALKEQNRVPEALAAFDQAIALKPDYAQAHNGRGIALAKLNRSHEAIAAFDRAVALMPDYAEAHNNRGIVLHELKRLEDALSSFDRAIALQPNNARAHSNRGAALYDAKRLDDALASYDEAIALKGDYAEAYYNLGIVLQDLRRLDEALAALDRAIALKPDYAAAHNNRGVVLMNLRRLDEALAAFETTISLTGGFAEVHVNQSHCLLLMGRLEQGWRLHEWRKKTETPVGNRSFRQPLWLGREDVANKTLFIHWEQGLGDTIQFYRYGKLLKARGAKVVISVQEPLCRLLSQMDSDIRVLNGDEVPAAFDYHCPLMSLPLALGTNLKNIPSDSPYIFSDEQLRPAWDARLPPRTKPRIGLVWRGSTLHKNDHNRSIDIAALGPLFTADAHWISLQKDLGGGDSALLREFRIARLGEDLKDFSDTAAVVDLLDVVITVDTSVAHLAGAMGKPVWIFLPYNSDWRWLTGRDSSPWYPTARLFRQNDAGAWENPVGRVHAALREYV